MIDFKRTHICHAKQWPTPNKYISGVAGYDTPIWDVLAPKGEREEAGERLWGDRLLLFFQIRQAVPVGLDLAQDCCWAHWAQYFLVEKI